MASQIGGRDGAGCRRGGRDHRRHDRQQRVRDVSDVLVPHHADHERRALRVPPCQIRRKSARALRIVRRIQQHATAALDSEQFEPRRPFGCRQSLLDGSSRNRDAVVRRHLEQTHGDDCVADLVLAAKTECHRPVRAGGRGHVQPRAALDHLRLRSACRAIASTSVAPRSAAQRRITAAASGRKSPMTTVIPGLMIPAFSNAIAPSVSPRCCWWSKSIVVIAPATA